MTVYPMILRLALPLAYGVEGYALKNSIAIKTKATIAIQEKTIPQNVYAFHIPWNNRVSAQVLSLLHQIISKYVLL
jgi:hypothetical protein